MKTRGERKSCMTCKYYKVIELHGVLQSEICTYGTDDGDYSECVSCQYARMFPFLCGADASRYEEDED